MSDSEINELFTYLSQKQSSQISGDKLKDIFSSVFKQSSPSCPQIRSLKKDQFAQVYKKTIRSPNIEEDLLFLFYHLDKQKYLHPQPRKGYLSPNDVIKMFETFGKKVTLNEVENSFKYAKVFKNKMSFEDFKEYFYNF